MRDIDLAGFLKGLCQQFQTSGPEHAIGCDIAQVLVSTDDAVTLGLLANELVTNAIKYAPPAAAGDVRLTVTALDRGELRFEVRDHGPGLPAEFDGARSKSLGIADRPSQPSVRRQASLAERRPRHAVRAGFHPSGPKRLRGGSC